MKETTAPLARVAVVSMLLYRFVVLVVRTVVSLLHMWFVPATLATLFVIPWRGSVLAPIT